MASTIIMPQLGETVAEGKILAWFKSVGDEVKEGDNLFEVETDKVTIEVQAVTAGRLSEIRVGAGITAKVGEVVAVVSDRSAKARLLGDSAKTSSRDDTSTENATQWRSPFEEVSTSIGRFGPAKGPNGIHLTPLARRLIVQRGLDLAALARKAERQGEKRIDGAAVRAATGAQPTAPPAPFAQAALPPVQDGDVITLNAVRQKTGERLAEAWRAIPHVFQAIEVDFTAVDRVRKARKVNFQTTQGFALTFLPFIARATCLAISAYPQINARFDGKALTLSRDVNLGIAVDLDHNGLIVPVVRNASELTLIGLAKAIRRQIDKAKSGKLSLDDLSGGTYSISNNGGFGTTLTAPIINAPQVGILSTDAIRLRPGVVSTQEGDFVAPRMIGTIGQSFDHRAFDGAYSAAFLSRLKQILETRNWDEEFPSDPLIAIAPSKKNSKSSRKRQ
jgi:pyruvate/2-oxoglutarate dehydrogenase complex dihydrolipoamide acyltransferase (E2) component